MTFNTNQHLSTNCDCCDKVRGRDELSGSTQEVFHRPLHHHLHHPLPLHPPSPLHGLPALHKNPVG